MAGTLFEFIKARVAIADVVKEYTTLIPAGSYLKGPCPLHSERTASFTVSPAREIFYCFGCQQGGDVIEFITCAERFTPWHAALHLVTRYQLTPPPELLKGSRDHEQSKAHAEIHFRTCQLVATWCQERFARSAPAQAYVQGRGISIATAQHFKVGYWPGGPKALQQLISWCKEQQVMVQDLLDAHVLKIGENKQYYSPFQERIIFPIADTIGRICAFGGRVFLPEDTRAKYYNLQDHAHFHKQKIVYGLSEAKRAIQEHQEVVLVEGYLDVLALWQAGVHHTVATLGTACTAEHLRILGRFARSITVFYDGDTAGVQATMRLALLAWQQDIDIRVAAGPAGADPADIVAARTDPRPFLAQAQTVFDFYVRAVAKPTGTQLADKVHALRDLAKVLALIQDPLKRHILSQQAAVAYGIPQELMLDHMRKAYTAEPRAPEGQAPDGAHQPSTASPGPDIAQQVLVGAILAQQFRVPDEVYDILVLLLDSPLVDILTWHRAGQTGPQPRGYARVMMVAEQHAPLPPAPHVVGQYIRKRWKSLVNHVKLKVSQAADRDEQTLNYQKLHDLEHIYQQLIRYDTRT